MAARALPRPWQSSLDRTRARLAAKGLLHVLDSLPAPSCFEFYEPSSRSGRTIKLHLGYRKQGDDTLATSWAHVQLDRFDIMPPVRFRDKLPTVDDAKPVSYPRRASSLLRMANGLLPPFRFLQFHSGGTTSNVRGMLCALVLYYAMANGLTDVATSWKNFESSLSQALTYIDSSLEYQRWYDQLEDYSTKAPVPPVVNFTTSQSDESNIAPDDVGQFLRNGGTVRSSSISARPGTYLARLQEALKENVDLLDLIPSTPITIERQDLFPTYFPFRLRFGKHGKFDVHVYFTHDGRNSTKIMAHGDHDHVRKWTFEDLSGIQLYEPFAFIMSGGGNLKTRGHKIRYLVNYYLMLADNEGLIDDPKIRIDPENMLTHFCAACRSWKKAAKSSENTSGMYPDEEAPGEAPEMVIPEYSAPTRRSLLLTFQFRPKDLANATEGKSTAFIKLVPAKRLNGHSNIVNLTSDGVDTFMLDSPESELERPYDINGISCPERRFGQQKILGNLRLQPERLKKKKRRIGYKFNKDEEEAAEEEWDGYDAWTRASFK